MIDERMAHDLFPGEDPIGKQLHAAFFEVDAQIIGVTADVKQFGLDVPAAADNALRDLPRVAPGTRSNDAAAREK